MWDLETLAAEQALEQPGGDEVRALLAVEGEVWAGVGRDVVVWGRKG